MSWVCYVMGWGQGVPEPIDGWKMELILQAPAIAHPSVVCSAPDGRVFVAEDPMDISAPANAALGRIVCLHPDGRLTVFAEGLHAVFGMQYLEGKLYVLHNPKFSVFRDEKGIGKERTDLIGSTHPNPWALDWNDHVPANFRLNMDGYFYVAVGDKGMYGAVGRDGRRLDLHGGGIVRMRPDGTGLEIYSTGVRNILDVAVNEEDEIFTYDNTDEQQWMGRVTHMVDGGFYGYPYDFIPRQRYTLWMLADYGAGAATGTLCYTDDVLPGEYYGNLFLADFGKRQVMRAELKREGGTFGAVRKEDLFRDPPADFRPVGISWGADGRTIYICDWNHRDIKAQVRVGRLWKMTYAGATGGTEKPGWYVAAACGETITVSDEELVGALGHPSRDVRMVAQRRLAGRGPGAERLLTRLLIDSSQSPRARWHALWALDAMDGGKSARAAIERVAQAPEASIRRQAARQLGTRRAVEAAPVMEGLLKDPDPSVRFQAATALGRMRAVGVCPALLEALDEDDLFARFAVFTALRRIGTETDGAWNTIAQGLISGKEEVREGTRFAMREVYDLELVDVLAGLALDSGVAVERRVECLELLAERGRRVPEWKGEWWAYHPVNAPPPERTVKWDGSERIGRTLIRALTDSDAGIRRVAIRGISKVKETAAREELARLHGRESDGLNRASIVRAAGILGGPAMAEVVLAGLRDSELAVAREAILAAERMGGDSLVDELLRWSAKTDSELLPDVLRALGKLDVGRAVPRLGTLARAGDLKVKEAAIAALGRIQSEPAAGMLTGLMEDESAEVRRLATREATEQKRLDAAPLLLERYQDPETKTEALAGLMRKVDPRAVDVYLENLTATNAMTRESARQALRSIRAKVLLEIEKKVDALGPEVISELRRIYGGDESVVKSSKIFTAKSEVRDAAEYERHAIEHRGDARKGRAIFFDASGAACVRCHAVNGEGGIVGPDLSNIAAQARRETLIESVLYPNRAMREGYQGAELELGDEERLSGRVTGETAELVVLVDREGKQHQVPKARIRSRRASSISLMPEGIEAGLTLEQFSDLIAYLETLRGSR